MDVFSYRRRFHCLVSFDDIMFQRSSACSPLFFEKMFMTLGCLEWYEPGKFVNGEVERSQLVVITFVIELIHFWTWSLHIL